MELYPQEISTGEKLRPSHGKNNQLIQRLLHMFQSTNVVKSDPDFSRSYHSWHKIAFIFILCYILQEILSVNSTFSFKNTIRGKKLKPSSFVKAFEIYLLVPLAFWLKSQC